MGRTEPRAEQPPCHASLRASETVPAPGWLCRLLPLANQGPRPVQIHVGSVPRFVPGPGMPGPTTSSEFSDICLSRRSPRLSRWPTLPRLRLHRERTGGWWAWETADAVCERVGEQVLDGGGRGCRDIFARRPTSETTSSRLLFTLLCHRLPLPLP